MELQQSLWEDGEGRSVLAAVYRPVQSPGLSRAHNKRRQGEREKGGARAWLIPSLLTHWAVRPAARVRSATEKNMAGQSFLVSPGKDPERARDARRARSRARPSASGAASRILRQGSCGARERSRAAGAQWAEMCLGEGRGEDQPGP